MSDTPEMLFGDIPFFRANREPCIVCGHLGGDCTTPTAEPEHIIGVSTSLGSLSKDHKILVEKDIVEEKQITPFTKAKILVARAGSYVTVEKAKELGII
jgi:hypothetical protein